MNKEKTQLTSSEMIMIINVINETAVPVKQAGMFIEVVKKLYRIIEESKTEKKPLDR